MNSNWRVTEGNASRMNALHLGKVAAKQKGILECNLLSPPSKTSKSFKRQPEPTDYFGTKPFQMALE